MERVSQYQLYDLAAKLSRIHNLRDDMDSFGASLIIIGAVIALEPYCKENPPVRLTLALKSVKQLLEALETLDEQFTNQRLGKPAGLGLAGPNVNRVKQALESFEIVLRAECESRPAFIAPKRGIYDTEELVNAAAKAIPPSLQSMVPQKAAGDLDDAGRCLAFGLFTAAGFHMCRAVEAVLEEYYHRFTGKGGTLNGWKDYIDALNKAIASGHKPAAEPQTLTYLSQLKDSAETRSCTLG